MKITYRLVIGILLCFVVWKTINYFLDAHGTRQQETMIPSAMKNGLSERIKVSVYYEALCSDSRFFILKQLVPAYHIIPEHIELDLVPYGKAKTFEENGKITFECQHGMLECLANKIHACSLKYITEPDLQLKYIACMINDNMIPNAATEKCAEDLGINYVPIGKCAEEMEGSLLLREYGIRTNSLNPPATFIPTVELNDNQKVPQTLILKNLLKELCNLLAVKPTKCL